MNIEKEVGELMAKKGNIKGEILRDHFIYIDKKEGAKGVSKMEQAMADLGYPLKFQDLKPHEWYPDAYCGLILLILKEKFGWSEKDIYEMGEAAAKYSLILKFLLRYLISTRKFLAEVSRHWGKHLDFGFIEVAEIDEDKKKIILRVKDYDIHSTTCPYQSGYYAGILRYTTGGKNIRTKETKCIYRGDPYHEYLIEWE